MRMSTRTSQTLVVVLLAFVASPVHARQSDSRAVVVVEGHVTDEFSGAPISDAQIEHLHMLRSTAVTDSAGRYRMEIPYRGVFLTFSAVNPGFLPETREQQFSCLFAAPRGEVPTCDVEFDFEMRRVELEPSESPRCTISGTVFFRRDHSPVEGAGVRVDGTEIWAQSGPDGAYVLSGVPAGFHRVTARTASTFPLSRLVVVRCASPQGGPTLPLQLSPNWIP